MSIYISYHPVYAHPLPEGHRFPMIKYELIPEQLLYEGSISIENIFAPEPCADEVLLWTHERDYLNKLKNQALSASEQRKIGFPQSLQLTHREIMIAQGTINCCIHAMIQGVALNVAGGTHHAYADRGEGFCLLNDFAIAANYLLHQNPGLQILIIDLDVHQGNGTAKIFEQEPRVFTFSMHGAHNYPFHKEKSHLDIALPDGMGDAGYLSLLEKNLIHLFQSLKPDIVFFLSGVDILETDKYGKLKISMQGCRQRDEMVFHFCKDYKTPVAVAMGGGYSADIRIIMEAHCNTFRAAKEIFQL